MRTFFATLAFAVMSLSAFADNYQYITVSQSGSETSFQISQVQKITFDATDMVITLNDGAQQRLPLATLSKMTFTESGTSAVETPTDNRSQLSMRDGMVYVDVQGGETVTIYNIKGEVIFTSAKSASFPADRMPKGAYILRIGQQTKKILGK